MVGNRFGVSDRAVAAIASSVLNNVGFINRNNSDLVVDKNELRRETAKVRKDLKFQALSEEISQEVRLGNCSYELARHSPGTLSHSRWLTTANRILRLYDSSLAPSLKLEQIVEFAMKFYIPNWFNIKTKHSLKDGAKHVWNTISRCRYLSQDLKDVVNGVICRNSFFAYPENILLCMLKNERPHIRELAARLIIKSRESSSNVKSVRVFIPPKLNFDADDYTEMID
ncbi:hypothetical protein AVEN_168781-1 [Araneus ventricosus]|uniref:Uncharacterized protein n=1 Tax=Araneus ventricosus TaxID=182803 RepID=A0A4Y2K7R1_ARAVE|nr:hypothetical protein AVEN_168781-1 [Araneus ventricosus]